MPDLNWSVNTIEEDNNNRGHTGTVIMNAESNPYQYEGEVYKPAYQVIIRSRNKSKAELYAYKTFKMLNKMSNQIFKSRLYNKDDIGNWLSVTELTVKLLHMHSPNGIIPLGYGEDKTMEYSINFDSVLLLISEEEI